MLDFKRFIVPLLISLLWLMESMADEVVATDSNETNHEVLMHECINGASSAPVAKPCCHSMESEDIPLVTCTQIIARRPKFEDRNPKLVELSIFTECLYKKRNYMKSKNRLNMGAIKAEAKRLYHHDHAQKNFMIEMYRDCGRKATKQFAKFQDSPKYRELLKKLHKPYFMLIFMCVNGYAKTNCPYFFWNGWNKSEEKICQNYVDQCKKLLSN